MTKFPLRPGPRGFTLVEMLVTVALIALLFGLILGALHAAGQTSRIARTEAAIRRLDSQLLDRWEAYHTRRLPIDPEASIWRLATVGVANPNAHDTRHLALLRLWATRELMRMELPDRFDDFFDPDAPDLLRGCQFLDAPPSLARVYCDALRGQPRASGEFESAECLYLILSLAADGESPLSFGNHLDTGDADGNGLLEFHDAWGRPICFLRWAPGFVSALQPLFALDPKHAGTPEFHQRQPRTADGKLLTRDPQRYHDAFDPLQVDAWIPGQEPPERGYTLHPLIFSAGPDGAYDIVRHTTTEAINDPYGSFPRQPLRGAPDVRQFEPRDGDGQGYLDNLHNHQRPAP